MLNYLETQREESESFEFALIGDDGKREAGRIKRDPVRYKAEEQLLQLSISDFDWFWYK